MRNKKEGSAKNITSWIIIMLFIGIAATLAVESNKIEGVIQEVIILQRGFDQIGDAFTRITDELEENIREIGTSLEQRIYQHLDRIEDRLNESPDIVGSRAGKVIDEHLSRLELKLDNMDMEIGSGIEKAIYESLERIESKLGDNGPGGEYGKTLKKINESLDRVERDLKVLKREIRR